MEDIKTIIRDLASIEYDLFVVNTHAVAVQGEDGKYYTKYFPISQLILQSMITRHGSLGCYQQVYNSNYIRWICLDFDCRKGTSIDLDGLLQSCILPITKHLDKHKIHYLLEFSGRRGIHIWIIIDRLIKKSLGYQIINSIMNAVPEVLEVLIEGHFGLDKFPATGLDKKSKVGKQVKFPLSWHKQGTRSFFISKDISCARNDTKYSFFADFSDYLDSIDFESYEFYNNQLKILQGYELETKESLCEKLGILEEEKNKNIYTKYSLIKNYSASLGEIIDILSGITVYRNIFCRMKRGQPLPQDWLIILGTFSCFNACTELLTLLFGEYPNYDVNKTLYNIKKYRNQYYPATFEYLYTLYNLEMEPELDPQKTGVDYLAEKLLFEVDIREKLKKRNINDFLIKTEIIAQKELDYLIENDEVISVSLRNKLENIKEIEFERIEAYVNHILGTDRRLHIDPSFILYERLEEEGRIRQLVSLNSFDRIVTTSLTLHLCREMKHAWKSYSYRISYLESSRLFYPWFSSWGRYIDEIKRYLELPFMKSNYVVYLDIKHCYDNIDILVVYNKLKNSLSKEGKRAFEYLCVYNDCIMKKINQGKRIGVPQGPAYARIMTEIYLDEIIIYILNAANIAENCKLFRYVDDIVVFCEDEEQSNLLYKTLIDGFGKCGLPINTKKSHNYGKISDLSQAERNELLHKKRFNYDLVENAETEIVFDAEKKKRLMKYLRNNPFEICLVGYIFSGYTFPEAKEYCFNLYGKMIMASREGRGKHFRQFYQYLLSSTDRIIKAIHNGWFQGIPLNSINFSNFISTLYFMIRDSLISEQDVRLIILFYLEDGISSSDLSDEDRATIEAIILKYR